MVSMFIRAIVFQRKSDCQSLRLCRTGIRMGETRDPGQRSQLAGPGLMEVGPLGRITGDQDQEHDQDQDFFGVLILIPAAAYRNTAEGVPYRARNPRLRFGLVCASARNKKPLSGMAILTGVYQFNLVV